MLGRPLARKSLFALMLLVLGPALVVHSEVDVTLFGVLATVSVVLLTSLKVVLSTLLFSSNLKWDSLSLLAEMSPKASLLLLPWSAYEIFSQDATYQLGHLGLYMIFLLMASGVAAFLLNYNNFLMFKYMDSPVAVAVFTNVRKVLTIAVSVFVFDHEIGLLNMLGMAITFTGVALYSIYEINKKKASKDDQKSTGRLEIV